VIPQYSWRCFVCDSANEAGAAACSACGFPAGATGAQIEQARAVRSGVTKVHAPPVPSFMESVHAALAPLPPHRRAVAVIGGVLTLVGIAWFKVTFSWSGLAESALTFVAGVLLVASAYSGTVNEEGTRNAG
jgi:hypothetical protein